MKLLSVSIFLAGVLATSAQSSFTVELTAAHAGTASTGSGSGTLFLNGSTLIYDITYSGLTSAPYAAHIHGPFGIVTGLTPLGPLTEDFGHYVGSVVYTASDLEHLLSGSQYVNMHTTMFPGGEISGAIVPVPEPSGLALAAVFLGICCWRFPLTLPRKADVQSGGRVGSVVRVLRAAAEDSRAPAGFSLSRKAVVSAGGRIEAACGFYALRLRTAALRQVLVFHAKQLSQPAAECEASLQRRNR